MPTTSAPQRLRPNARKSRTYRVAGAQLDIDPLDISANTEKIIAHLALDAALVYDVLHGGYFPQANQRIDLLRQIYVAIKPGGLLSCYLTHIKKYGLTLRQLQHEIGIVGFSLEAQTRRKLVHDDHLVRGRIFRYSKPVPASTPKKGQSPRMKN